MGFVFQPAGPIGDQTKSFNTIVTAQTHLDSVRSWMHTWTLLPGQRP
jgi:hypothetical protein